MTPSISLLDIAHEIRPLLPELLGEKAEAVDQAVAGLLERAESGEDVNYEIDVLLGEHEATATWKRNRLRGSISDVCFADEKDSPLPGYSRLPGIIARTPDAVVYACPVPGCNSPPWFPVDAGDVIPSCKIHGVKLKLFKYVCPVPGCSSLHWFPVDAGDVIPSCKIHGVKFEPVSNV